MAWTLSPLADLLQRNLLVFSLRVDEENKLVFLIRLFPLRFVYVLRILLGGSVSCILEARYRSWRWLGPRLSLTTLARPSMLAIVHNTGETLVEPYLRSCISALAYHLGETLICWFSNTTFCDCFCVCTRYNVDIVL